MKATISAGQITYKLSDDWRYKLAKYDGEDVDIQIEPLKRSRTIQQNRYYFGVVCDFVGDLIHNSTGEVYSKEVVHEFLRKKFLPAQTMIDITTGEVVDVPLSTTRLRVEEFAQYLDEIDRFCLEFFGIGTPKPEEFFEETAKRWRENAVPSQGEPIE